MLATPNRTSNSGFFYPSANLSFLLSKALKLPATINLLKVRASASSVGSGGTSPYLTAFNYETAGSLFSGGLQTPALLANPNLLPLRTDAFEAGVEFKAFKNRLSADIAVYTGGTSDQHLRQFLPRDKMASLDRH